MRLVGCLALRVVVAIAVAVPLIACARGKDAPGFFDARGFASAGSSGSAATAIDPPAVSADANSNSEPDVSFDERQSTAPVEASPGDVDLAVEAPVASAEPEDDAEKNLPEGAVDSDGPDDAATDDAATVAATDDAAVPPSPAGGDLVITEIMFDPWASLP